MKVRVIYRSPLFGLIPGTLVEVAWADDWDCLIGYVLTDDNETGIAREVPLEWITEIDDTQAISAAIVPQGMEV